MKYLIRKLTEISAWLGFFTILAAFFLPRDYIALLGVIFILIPDELIKNWITKEAPAITKFFQDL